MKKHFIKGALITAIGLTSQLSIAQTGHWVTGGNATGGPDGVPTTATNNFIGTNNTNNTWLRMGVNGNQDIFIDNNPAQLLPASTSARPQGGHWVGLGRVFLPSTGTGANPLFSPQAHLHIHGGGLSTVAALGGFTGGLRPWQQTGTLYTENTNGMYCGLKSMFNGVAIANESYAVVNWSDDQTGGFPTDYLTPLNKS